MTQAQSHDSFADDETLADLDSAAVEQALLDQQRGRSFPQALERRFEADTGDGRAVQLFRAGLLGVVVYVSYLWADWQLTPDVFAATLGIRIVVVLPVALGLLLVLLSRPPAWLRETVGAALPLIATFSTFAVMLSSDSPVRVLHLHSIVVVILYLAVVQRLRFWFALAASLIIFAGHTGALALLDNYGASLAIVDTIILGIAVVMAQAACWGLERESRTGYLVNLRARLRSRSLESMSLHDPLTGLENRRALDSALASIAEGRPGETVALVLFDIDFFKTYNDSLGHPAGDDCLKRIAEVALHNARGPDRVFRFGGEEFLLLLRRTELREALLVAERLRQAIEAAGIPHPGRAGGVVTASFGVAAARLGEAPDTAALILSADHALYQAKDSGRNRVWPEAEATERRLAS